MERRAKPRISERFPTTVSGIDKSGKSFEVTCVLENMSSTGLYLRLPLQCEQGSEVKMVVKLSPAAAMGAGAEIRGVALRSDARADDSWGLAVAISEYSFV